MRVWRVPFWAELAAALFLALALSTAASLFLLTKERQEALSRERLFGIAHEIRAVVAHAERGPIGPPPRMRGARLGFGPAPTIEADALPRESALVLSLLSEVGAEEVRLAPAMDRPPGLQPRRTRGERLRVAVRLADGMWLNGVIALPPPPPSPTRPLLLSVAISALALLAVSLWMGWRLTRPLQALAHAATAMRVGEPAPQAPVAGPAPVRAAAAAFNAMSAQVQATLDSQKALLAGLAHDLRTPITALRLRAALVDDPETRERIEASLDELSALTEAALSAARAAGDGEQPRNFDLTAMADSLCQDLAELGLPVTFSEGPSIPVTARMHATRRALRNLIENAARYGGLALVTVARDGGQAIVVVEDEGPGIPSQDLEKVFDPFVRLEASRNQDTGGHGLGLTIARLAIRAQGGDIVLVNRPEGGLRAVLSLPASR